MNHVLFVLTCELVSTVTAPTSTINKAIDIERSSAPTGSSDDAAVAANVCERLTRQARRAVNFIRTYAPKK